ncbi:hypothetical protein BOX15_Mlig016225g2 [Macrostomum lignano]|uniref:Ion transport domain-containing protein n=2 Tax=Macrostomum lignano TaxID=282301 RepID=A0A267FLL3_9PLAT|nr:hypothetical protein BOX15_Mlig016225g2 [Macrostomum lignano]
MSGNLPDEVELEPLLPQSPSLPPPAPPPPPMPPRTPQAAATPASPARQTGRPQFYAITAEAVEEARSTRPYFTSLNQRSDSIDAADVSFRLNPRPSISGTRLAADCWQQQLLDAAKAKLFDKVVSLTKVIPVPTAGKKLLASLTSGRTAAHFAALDCRGAFALKALLEAFGPTCLLQEDNNCCTPILNACKCHCSQIITELVEAALSVDARCLEKMQDRNGDTCFHFAAGRRDTGTLIAELVKLVDCSGRLLLAENCSKQTPLHIACEEQPAVTVLQLVAQAVKADENCLETARDQNGDTCLHVAARKKDTETLIAKLVGEKGYCSEQCLLLLNNWKQTPLHIACDKQDAHTALKLIKLALAVNSDCLEMADHNLDTFFHIATRKRDNGMLIMEIVKMAASKEKGLLLENIWKQTPLHIACEFKGMSTALKLVELAQQENRYCLTQKCDQKKNTCFHMAAKRWHDGRLIVELVNRTEFKEMSLLQLNESMQTPMHIACRHQNAETVLELVFMALNAGIRKNFLEVLQDQSGDTCYHIAAKKRDNGLMIIELIKMADDKEKCILLENNNQRTPLHIVCEVQKPEICMKLLEIACKMSACPNLADSNGNTCLHYLSKNKRISRTEWSKIINTFGQEGLFQGNRQKQMPLHFLLEHQSWSVVEHCLALTSRHSLKLTDEAGNSCLHYAARGFQETFTRVVELSGLDSLKWLNKDRETPLQLALRHVPLPKKFDQRNKLYDFLVEYSDRISFRHANLSQGTLLHSLFMPPDNHFYADHNATLNHIRFVKLLCSSGVDPSRENNVHENFLHCSVLPTEFLAKILKYSSTDTEMAEILKRILVNSQGLHAAHTFSRRYDLKKILEPLAEISEMSAEDLVRLPVSKGPYAGATCLHFACEAGHKENIRFLLDKGLSLSYETHAGLSCIDFGFDKGRLDVISEVASANGVSQVDFLRLIDPPKCGLKLPDLETARKSLALIADASVLAEVEKDRNTKRQDDGGGASLGNESDEFGADISILCKAFEQDSPVILRCAIRLKLLSLKAEKEFLSMFSCELDAGPTKEIPMILRRAKAKQGFSLSRNSSISSLEAESLTMSDVAALHERVNILPDLIIIRQFDIIPCALNAIIQLKSKVVAREGKHDQLSKLRKRIITVTATCLDDLYLNGFVQDKELLYNYIRGDINFESNSDEDDDSSRSSTKGPKFSSRSSLDGTTGFKTVLKLIEESDCDDMFATECMHHFVCSDWAAPKPDAVVPMWKLSAKKKFYSYFFSFIVFLCVFAYHIICFRLPLSSTEVPPRELALLVVIALYALSFTCHEIDDFYRRKCKRRTFAFGKGFWCPQYFKDMLNYFDILAILAMWTGVLLNLTGIVYAQSRGKICHANQIVLSTSFLLWGFRSVAFLYYYHKIGPVISILGSLIIKDLLPFLLLIFIIFYSFGVFFLNLLFPVAAIESDDRAFSVITAQIFTMPFYMMFGIFEKFDFNQANSSEANSTNVKVGEIAHPRGHWWFYNILIFAFLILVNIVMVNLLIALFSLTVNRMADKALVIWRRKYYDMLQEYRHISFLPPPISFIYYLAKWYRTCRRRDDTSKCSKRSAAEPWWSGDGPDIPADYQKFLKLQALRFRVSRPKLLQAVSQNRGELQELIGHTEQLLEMQNESESAIERQADMLELMRESLDDGMHEIKFESQKQLVRLQGEMQSNWEQLQQAVTQLSTAQNSLHQELRSLREDQAALVRGLENQRQQMKLILSAFNQLIPNTGSAVKSGISK